ncbi:hypothetical protein Trydic_g888 [Trypoxylus dichotomus]
MSSGPLSDSRELSACQRTKLRYIPKSIPKKGIIAEVESTIRALPSVIADQIRFEAVKCIISAKPPSSNLTHEDTKALRNL